MCACLFGITVRHLFHLVRRRGFKSCWFLPVISKRIVHKKSGRWQSLYFWDPILQGLSQIITVNLNANFQFMEKKKHFLTVYSKYTNRQLEEQSVKLFGENLVSLLLCVCMWAFGSSSSSHYYHRYTHTHLLADHKTIEKRYRDKRWIIMVFCFFLHQRPPIDLRVHSTLTSPCIE